MSSNSLYVGNLPLDCDENRLKALFEGEGRTVAKVTLKKNARTGKSRGFGFVEMADEEQAQAALEALRGAEMDGRELRIGTAHNNPADGPTGGFGTGRYDESYGRRSGGRRRGRR